MTYVLNLKTGINSPQYHCVQDDNFTIVNTTIDVNKIKQWSGLYKAQPDQHSLVNQLDIMFEIQSTQLTVMDIAYAKPSSGMSSLVVTSQTSKNPRALRKNQREKSYLSVLIRT